MNKLYVNVNDYQGTNFAIGRTGTVEDWKQQADEWCDQDDNERFDWTEMTDEEVISTISEYWQIEIIECEMIGE